MDTRLQISLASIAEYLAGLEKVTAMWGVPGSRMLDGKCPYQGYSL